MKARVYRNLHRKCLSVQTMTPRGWRVTGHADAVTLSGVTFAVSQAGRARVLKEGRKNVHAFVIGTLEDPRTIAGVAVKYNPYAAPGFTTPDGAVITSAALATITPGGVVAALTEKETS
jgi:hypothetical protein